MFKIENTLPVEDDLPRKQIPSNIPFWSESYAFWAYPKEGDFGVYVHYQRQAADPRVWKCMTVLLLDDGSAYVMKAFGPQADDRGPGPETMQGLVLDPGIKYRFQFDGCAQRVQQSHLWEHELRDGVVEPVCIEFELDAVAPLWCMNASRLKQQSAAMHAHYEQAHLAKGRVIIGLKERQFEGYGYRDHSYGPRHYADMGEGNIVFGVFPSGRALWFLYTEKQDGTPGICEGAISVDGKMESAEIVAPPLSVKLLEKPELNYLFRARSGEVDLKVTYLGRGIPFTLKPPAEEIIGSVGGFGTLTQAYAELQIQLEWDGEIGLGSTQPAIIR